MESRQLSLSRHKARKKSFDTSDILFKLPEIEERYFHHDIWTDENGNVFRGINTMNTNNNNDDEKKKEEEEKEKKTKKIKKRIKKIVFLEIKIKRISEIDTTSETFRCRFHYYLTWLASKKEYDSYLYDGDEYKPDWIPKIDWTNAAEVYEHFQGSDFSIKTNKSVGFNSEWRINNKYLGFEGFKGKWNRVRYEADVKFAEELELESFPFDCQDLSLYMKVEKDNIDSCDIVPFPREGDFILMDPQFSVLSEWYLENLVTEFGFTSPLKSKSLRCYSLVSIHLKASRRWEAHIGMIIITFCIFSLGLGTFAQSINADVLGERLGFCVTFLLADVCTLQLNFQNLPNIPYWTILDFYSYTSFIFLFAVTIWSCFAGANYQNDEKYQQYDYIAFWVFLSMYILIHIIYISISIYYRMRERSKLTMTSWELIQYFKGQRSITDRRAISNTWNQKTLNQQSSNQQSSNQQSSNQNQSDVTTFHFQGAKLEPFNNNN